MKTVFKLLVVLFVLPIFCNCEDTIERNGTLDEYIPANVAAVYKIKNLDATLSDLKNNAVLSNFQQTNFYTFITQKATLLKQLHPKSESILCMNRITDSTFAYTFITKQNDALFTLDSLQNKKIETLKFKKFSFQKISLDAEIAYTTIIDSVFIASSSQKILQEIIEGKTENNNTFKKINSVKDGAEFTAILKNRGINTTDSTALFLANWISLNVSILPENITATGIALARDSVPGFISVFEGQIPQTNNLQEIIPQDTESALIFSFSDAELLQDNLKKYRGETEKKTKTGIFETVKEIVFFNWNAKPVLILNSIDPALTDAALAPYVSQNSSFRDIPLYSFNETDLFENTFNPLVENFSAAIMTQVDSFFIFTEDEATAEALVSNFQNSRTLQKSVDFTNASKNISSASSLLFLRRGNSVPSLFSSVFNISEGEKILTDTKEYPLAFLQFSYDSGFAHVTFVCGKGEKSAEKTTSEISKISEKMQLKLYNDILGKPQFFTNTRTKSSDIVVQDVKNKLYSIALNGKTNWTKKLDGAVLGAFNEVDILKNGNRQLAFSTRNSLYVIDREGKDVKGFPIKFKDEITQPLAVFDYENTNNYRFFVTQGNTILLYDNSGSSVKGFNFKKPKSSLAFSPKHARFGNKDYILIAEDNGTLYIVDRVGKTRIPISKSFKFSEIPIQIEDNNFVIITEDGNKYSITESGKITGQKLDVSSTYYFEVLSKTKVTLDDNKLRINVNLIELPFGIYSKPQLYTNNRNTYVTVTETQENKVLVYTTKGTLLEGFPIFGKSEASIAANSKIGEVSILVIGEKDTVLLYTTN